MAKIRITENELKQVIRESVVKALKENYRDDAQNAYKNTYGAIQNSNNEALKNLLMGNLGGAFDVSSRYNDVMNQAGGVNDFAKTQEDRYNAYPALKYSLNRALGAFKNLLNRANGYLTQAQGGEGGAKITEERRIRRILRQLTEDANADAGYATNAAGNREDLNGVDVAANEVAKAIDTLGAQKKASDEKVAELTKANQELTKANQGLQVQLRRAKKAAASAQTPANPEAPAQKLANPEAPAQTPATA